MKHASILSFSISVKPWIVAFLCAGLLVACQKEEAITSEPPTPEVSHPIMGKWQFFKEITFGQVVWADTTQNRVWRIFQPDDTLVRISERYGANPATYISKAYYQLDSLYPGVDSVGIIKDGNFPSNTYFRFQGKEKDTLVLDVSSMTDGPIEYYFKD